MIHRFVLALALGASFPAAAQLAVPSSIDQARTCPLQLVGASASHELLFHLFTFPPSVVSGTARLSIPSAAGLAVDAVSLQCFVDPAAAPSGTMSCGAPIVAGDAITTDCTITAAMFPRQCRFHASLRATTAGVFNAGVSFFGSFNGGTAIAGGDEFRIDAIDLQDYIMDSGFEPGHGLSDPVCND